MKKLLVIALMLVYGLSATGMTLHLHYCCGRLDGISLSPAPPKKCPGYRYMSQKSCCDHQQVQFRISAEQHPAKYFQTAYDGLAVPAPLAPYGISRQAIIGKPLPEVFAPPPLPKDFRILYCVYRI